jgi:hypothetical protein
VGAPVSRSIRVCERIGIVWLPHLDPGAVIVSAAPEGFRDARSLERVTPTFECSAGDASYWLVNERHGRLPVVLIGGASAATSAAVVIPLDADFGTRADAALRLWRIATGRPRVRPPERLTRQRRHRLAVTLRALDARLADQSYRVIAKCLFGRARIPAGPTWKTHELRDRTIRLARGGMELMQGGYLDLLRYPRFQHE